MANRAVPAKNRATKGVSWRVVRLKIPEDDEATLAWVSQQDDASISIRLLVADAIARAGYRDYVSAIVSMSSEEEPRWRGDALPGSAIPSSTTRAFSASAPSAKGTSQPESSSLPKEEGALEVSVEVPVPTPAPETVAPPAGGGGSARDKLNRMMGL